MLDTHFCVIFGFVEKFLSEFIFIPSKIKQVHCVFINKDYSNARNAKKKKISACYSLHIFALYFDTCSFRTHEKNNSVIAKK